MRERSVAGVILAGGRSRRLGGTPKALQALAGKTLLEHVIERFRPQVATLALSVERASPDWARFGLPQLPDPAAGFRGPLGGLLAALDAAGGGPALLAVAPCDAPFLPPDLVARLHRRLSGSGAEAAVARCEGVLQPTFSLWRSAVLERLRPAVLESGLGGFRQFLAQVDWVAVDWPPAEPPPFFNINDPDGLADARRRLGDQVQ